MSSKLAKALVTAVGAALCFPAHAVNFDWEGAQFAWTSKITAGAAWRMSPRDDGRLGKLNVRGQQNLCSNHGGQVLKYGIHDDDCLSLFGDPAPNLRLVNAKGGYFTALMDDGDLNFDNGDLTSAIVKINTQLTMTRDDWTVKLNYVGFYDDVNYNLRLKHPNTQYQPASERVSSSVQGRAGLKGEFREAFVQYAFNVADRDMSIAVGNQRVRWGEANLHLFNTLDTVNPLDGILPLQPGFNLNELNVPTGMVLFSADLVENVSAEVLYQYDWDSTRVQPSGTFFSTADPAGIANYNPVLSLGQFPEDPNNQFVPGLPFRLLSSSTRNSAVSENENHPRDGNQYGIRVNWYAENLNNGTEFGFYYLNYHSRLPYFSINEADQTCLRKNDGIGLGLPSLAYAATALLGCATFNPYALGNIAPGNDPLPINSAHLRFDYPENIHMFGVSFNTTAFGWSVSGEYSYRPNLPAQVLITDVFYAGFQQAFASRDVGLDVLGIAGAALPGARTFIPDYLSRYRGRTAENDNEYQPGEYVRGYERLKTGQFVINALKLFPSHFGADDITVLGEFGFENIYNMPKKGDLYIQGTLEHTHPSPGADCTGFPSGTDCSSTTVVGRINPTQQTHGFATAWSGGVRTLIQANYSNVGNSGINLKPTLLVFRDLFGISPYPAQNYVKGNLWLVGGFQYEIGQSFNGTLLYMYFDGRDQLLQDRDNISVSLTYNF